MTEQVKLCECGCGLPAPIATQTSARWGAIEGKPRRFIHGHNNRQAADRFWERVDKRDPDDCWVWQGPPFKHGYGQFYLNGKQDRPNRVSWKLTYGSIPDNLHVLHKCDNPPCCNPYHLFLGTPAENAADKVAKGRQSRYPDRKGEAHPNHKLTEDMVRAIRRRVAAGERRIRIARDYGVTADTVVDVARRRVWKHVP